MAAARWDWGCCGEEDEEEMIGEEGRRPFQLEKWTSTQEREDLRRQRPSEC